MACFVVPAAEAIVTTAVQKIIRKKGKDHSSETALKFSEKLGVLNGLFWGGSGLLAFEHIWHGEITPFFPFLLPHPIPDRQRKCSEKWLFRVRLWHC